MNDTVKGRDYVLSVSTDSGSSFNPVAGIRVKELTRENPVADATNQVNTGNETGAEFTGYATVTMSGSGVADKTVTGLFPFVDLVDAANSSNPVLLFKLENASLGIYQGDFLITSFAITTEQNDLVNFTIALQNKGDITFTKGV